MTVSDSIRWHQCFYTANPPLSPRPPASLTCKWPAACLHQHPLLSDRRPWARPLSTLTVKSPLNPAGAHATLLSPWVPAWSHWLLNIIHHCHIAFAVDPLKDRIIWVEGIIRIVFNRWNTFAVMLLRYLITPEVRDDFYALFMSFLTRSERTFLSQTFTKLNLRLKRFKKKMIWEV